MAARSRILPLIGGLTVLGGGSYYLYNAGGDTKVARKQVEQDAQKVKERAKGNEYSAKEAQKEGEVFAQKVGSTIDSTVEDARKATHDLDTQVSRKAREAEDKLSSFTKNTMSSAQKEAEQTRKEAHNAIENFDKTVERKTSEAKTGIASWFGFGGK